MMETTCTDEFDDLWLAFKVKYEDKFPVFYHYFETLWHNRKELWSKAYRQVS